MQNREGQGRVCCLVRWSHPLSIEAGLYKAPERLWGRFLHHASSQGEGGSTSSTMTELETAMGMIISVFARYAGVEGSKQSLTKGELKVLMEKELPGFLQTKRDRDSVDKLLKDLDANGDAEVDFSEFIVFVATLTAACHQYFERAGLP